MELNWNMKYECLESSNRKSPGGVKLLIVFLVLLIGVAYAAESRYAFFRLIEVNTSAPEIIDASTIWGTVTSQEERFWPAFFINREKHEKILEKFYPVKAHITFKSWGRFFVTITKLNPSLKMYWGTRYWYVFNNGKAWSVHLPSNKHLNCEEATSKPILVWSSDRPLPINLENNDGNIHNTSLNFALLGEWYRHINTLHWAKDIKYIMALIKNRKPYVELVFSDKNGNDGVHVILNNNPENWIEYGMAINKLYPDLKNASENVLIDATYNNKILIKNIRQPNN